MWSVRAAAAFQTNQEISDTRDREAEAPHAPIAAGAWILVSDSVHPVGKSCKDNGHYTCQVLSQTVPGSSASHLPVLLTRVLVFTMTVSEKIHIPRRLDLWNRPFVFLNLCCFLVFTNIGLLYLYPLALEAMGTDKHTTGWVMGVFSIAAVLSRPSLGKLALKKGEQPVMRIGVFLMCAACLCYFPVTGFSPLLLLVRVVHGVGFSAFIAGSFSLLARDVPPSKRGTAFSMVGITLMAAVALGPPLGEAMIGRFGFTGLYSSATLSAILAWIALFKGLGPARRTHRETGEASALYLPLLRDRSLLFLLASTLIFAHSQATVANFLALTAAQEGTYGGRFFFVSYTTAIIALLFTGRAIDRFGGRFFLLVAYPFLCMSLMLVPGTIASPLFSVTAAMFGIGMGVLFATHNALVASHGSEREKPAVMSIFTAVYDTGFITGAVVSGWLAHRTGLDMLFIFSGVFSFLGPGMAILSRDRKC